MPWRTSGDRPTEKNIKIVEEEDQEREREIYRRRPIVKRKTKNDKLKCSVMTRDKGSERNAKWHWKSESRHSAESPATYGASRGSFRDKPQRACQQWTREWRGVKAFWLQRSPCLPTFICVYIKILQSMTLGSPILHTHKRVWALRQTSWSKEKQGGEKDTERVIVSTKMDEKNGGDLQLFLLALLIQQGLMASHFNMY